MSFFILIGTAIIIVLIIWIIFQLQYREDFETQKGNVFEPIPTSDIIAKESQMNKAISDQNTKIDEIKKDESLKTKGGEIKREVCIRPDSNKETVMSAINVLDDKIEMIDYLIKQQNKKYEQMYQWYVSKVNTDQVKNQENINTAMNQMNSTISNTLNNAMATYQKQNEQQYYDNLKKSSETPATETPESQITGNLVTSVTATGDSDDKKDVERSLKELDAPKGYF